MPTFTTKQFITRDRPRLRKINACVSCWALMAIITTNLCATTEQPANPYTKWLRGPQKDPAFFPVAVWLQNPRNAEQFKELGFNVYVGLWKGPTSAQLAALKHAGMPVICKQNDVGLSDKNNDIIIGWMHGDEPDNAQPLGEGKGYGPPLLPDTIKADYDKLVQRDPSRPILLNLGQGVAWDGWHGRGVRTNHPEDYPEYVRGCDIASFDIYPVVHDKAEVAGKLEFVARGVDRLHEWSQGQRIVWNCIECTRISNVNVKPTPAQVRSEVWMSLIHGSQGLIYFVHQFKPNFIEAGLLADKEMALTVKAINEQIHGLASVLNTPTLDNVASVESSDANVPIDIMVKQDQQATTIFAVSMRNAPTMGTFTCKQKGATTIEVLGEDRTLELKNSVFTDAFAPYAVHLYRLKH